jgi:DNA-binding transcriptional LysR family regulator
VREAFESLSAGEDKLKRALSLGVGHIQIGVSSTLCKHILLPYLKEYIRRNPHVSISIQCESTNEILRLLDEHKIDIGLIGRPELAKGIHFDHVEFIEDIFVATKEYLQHIRDRGIAEDDILGNATLTLLDKNNMTRQYIDDYLTAHHIEVAETIDASNMDLLIEFAKIGVGISCVIKSFVTKELADGSLVEVPLPFPLEKREVGFAYKEQLAPTKTLLSFIQFYENYNPEENQ